VNMKSSYNNIFKRSTRLLTVAILALFVISCSKEKTTIEPPSTLEKTADGSTVVAFAVDDVIDLKTMAKANSGNKTRGNTEFFQSKDGAVNAFLEMTSGAYTAGFNQNQQQTIQKAAASGLKAGNLPTTAKYRLLLYDNTNTVLKKNIEIQSGSSPQIPVDAGVAYKWYAVSTNESSTPTVSNGKIAKSDLTNKDVLYASGTFTPQYGAVNKVPITFKHLNVAYSINLDSRGAFASINSSSQMAFPGTNVTLYAGDLALFTGVYENETAISASSLTSSMTTTTSNPSTGNAVVKNAVFYSSKGQTFDSSNRFSVNFTPLSLTIDEDNSVVSKNQNYIFTKDFTTASGFQYNFNVQLSPSGSIINGSNIWAPTNLMYVPGKSGTYAYRFRKSNAYASADPNEFWKWNTLSPEGFLGSGDPCKQVFPENTWRLPTPNEFANLGSTPSSTLVNLQPSPGIFGTAASVFVSRAYVAWQWRFGGNSKTIEEEYTLSTPINLILPFNGYMAINRFNGQDEMQNEPVAAALGFFYYSQGHYWTSSAYKYQLMRDDQTFIFAQKEFNSVTTSVNTERRNIRCIRSKP